MPVIPTGAPAWVRTNDFSTYGGHTEKQNLLGRGAINAKTDVGAEGFARLAADLAAVQRVAPFGELTLLCNDGSPAAPTFEYVNLMTGVRTTSYAGDNAPTGYPSGARNGNGDVSITFSSSYNDPYSVAGSFAVRHPRASVIGVIGAHATVERVSDTVIRVRGFDTGGVALVSCRYSVVFSSGQ